MSDLISRSAVLKKMDELIDFAYRNEDDDLHHTLVTVCSYIDEIPTLDVAPVVHARWIYYGEVNEDGNCEANCSACGAGDAHRADLKDGVPFCWKCGARMDGEEDAAD